MTEQQINELKSLAAKGGVYWLDDNGGVNLVSSVDLHWVEYPDEPDIDEPAAMLANGTAVALYNVVASSFVKLQPAIDGEYTLYWRDGKRQVVPGKTIEDAMSRAGYGAGALFALDFYAAGNDSGYDWNPATKNWDRREKLKVGP